MAAQGTLAVSSQSDVELGTKLDISLTGVWVGTVALQRFMNGTWNNTGDSWTANDEIYIEGATPMKYRLDFTRTSGSLVYHINGVM